jgi:hypothetical protein
MVAAKDITFPCRRFDRSDIATEILRRMDRNSDDNGPVYCGAAVVVLRSVPDAAMMTAKA